MTTSLGLVGVSFMANPSLSSRYTSYLTTSPLTCETSLLLTKVDLVVVATGEKGTLDPIQVLGTLSTRQGFTRCSGRQFVMDQVSQSETEFLSCLVKRLPSDCVVRTHAHPNTFSKNILDMIDSDSDLARRGVRCNPTLFTLLLVAVRLDKGRVGWGLYPRRQYADTIARPGDGLSLPSFKLNFNRAELKLAEAVQHLTQEEHQAVFGKELLAVDVGAAPGGWTKFLLNYSENVKVVAVDPAELSPCVGGEGRVEHLQVKVEKVGGDGGELEVAGLRLVGDKWRHKFRLLVCDANLDVRDTVRELVLPLCSLLVQGGCLVITVKLGRRVGEQGVKVKVDTATNLLMNAGFREVRVVWLFGNSKNERTLLAVKG